MNNNNQTGSTRIDAYLSGLGVMERIQREQAQAAATTKAEQITSGHSSAISPRNNKHNSFAKRLAAIGLTLPVMFVAGCAATGFNPLEDISLVAYNDADEPIIPKNHVFNTLLNKSQSKKQREVLGSVGNFLADYNIRFADPIEETVTLEHSETKERKNITIRPALTWDEVMAMTLVYNDFSKNDLTEILNGGEIDSYELNNAYQMAILQLMGAHVLETRDNPVNIDMVLHTDEAKAFYEKYHEMFLRCKETTGEERLNAVKAFYDELYKDYPITKEVRTEGIAHADARASVQPYKFSIIPMVAASEIMFQNLEVDHTLTQEAIDYLNDIGACNIAEDILEKAELISLTTTQNDKYADYAAVRSAMIAFLYEKDAYVIDDDHRDLSDLPKFQEIVNGFLLKPYTYIIVSSYTVTEYYTEREEYRTTDRDEAVERAGEDAVRDAEEKAQEEMDRENEAAREEAEEEADKIADEIQQEEDKKREDLEDRVEESDEDLQDRIDDANDEINNGGTVNEDDLGHGTDIDDEHTDSNGNIDDSVKDITTDGSGAVDSGDPLPDPNAEEASYTSSAASVDSRPAYTEPAAKSQSSERTETSTPSTTTNETTTNASTESNNEPIYEYEEEYSFTSEEEIDMYIESLAAYSSYEEPTFGRRI